MLYIYKCSIVFLLIIIAVILSNINPLNSDVYYITVFILLGLYTLCNIYRTKDKPKKYMHRHHD